MSIERPEFPGWTRRRFVGAGLVAAGTALLGACAPGAAVRGPAAGGLGADLDDLGRKFRGRLLRVGSPLYDDARRVQNQAYDRHPLAMARCADLDDVRRCVELARRRELAVAIRGGGHSYAGFGVADGALQIDLAAFNTVTVDAPKFRTFPPDFALSGALAMCRIKELSLLGRPSSTLIPPK